MFIVISLTKRNIILAVVAILFCMALGSAGGFLTYDFFRTDIMDGIFYEDLSLGKLNTEGAIEKLKSYLKPRLTEPIVILSGDKEFKFTGETLGIYFDYPAMVESAYRVGRQGSWWRRRTVRQEILRHGHAIKPVFTQEDGRLNRAIRDLRGQVERKPEPARWEVLQNNEVKLVPASIGREVDIGALSSQVKHALSGEPPYQVELPFKQVKPRLDTEEAANLGIQEVIASYRTYFNPESVGRVKNIALAARAIHGKVLLPGETFSFNQAVGPRIPESGYQEAPIIVNGELVPGIGGGVCQVSTTLYNAAVLADLSILERNRHTLPSAYVGLGRDATVFYDYLDLKILNETPRAVLLWTTVGNNYLDVKIISKWEHDWRVRISVEELQTIPPKWEKEIDSALDPGESIIIKEAHPGSKVRAWKEYVGSAGVINKELLSVDTYQPINGMVKVGGSVVSSVN